MFRDKKIGPDTYGPGENLQGLSMHEGIGIFWKRRMILFDQVN